LRSAYRNAGVAPGRVDYIEAHGTGTLLGDPIEARALGTVLADGREEGRSILLGSVKSNIGHLEAAAGIAGLIKTTLALRHRTIPASLHHHTPNPHIPFDELALRVVTEATSWTGEGPRIAGVSSFGFGGTNAHVVLEEAPARATTCECQGATGPAVLPISARNPEALRVLATSGKLDQAVDEAFKGVDMKALETAWADYTR
jgi:acyl transferase domain-containing protein